MQRVHAALRGLAAILGAAFVMAAWSEFVFFNEGVASELLAAKTQGPTAVLRTLGEIGLFYAIPGAVVVAAASVWGTAGAARAMLIAALAGYTIEGAVVPVVYEAVPVSYLWTSIAWHGPVTAGLGVFLLPRLLSRLTLRPMLLLALGLGAAWGIWMPWTWADPAVPRVDSVGFATHAAVTTAGMSLGYILLHASRWPDIAIPKPVAALIGLATGVLFVLQGAAHPVGALGLALILAVIILGLRRLGAARAAAAPLRPVNLVALWAMPATAAAVYALQLETPLPIAPEDLPAFALLAGTAIWLWLSIGGLRRRHSPAPRKATR